MELLAAVAANLRRHAEALERLADDLDRASPPPGTAIERHWVREDMDGRIRGMRREARLVRRALRRVRQAQRRHGPAERPADRRAAA